MSTLADLLNKSKTPPEKPKEIKSSSHDLLFGSGVTKRKAEQAERQQEKLQQKAFSIAEQNKEELGEIVNLNLPDSLMDDGIILDEFQQAAVNGLEFEKFGCLIGQAGVGKTTTAKALINKLIKDIPTINLNSARLENHQIEGDSENVAVCICSFMGKAVQQIKRALPKNYHPLCNTIHSTLGYSPVMEERIDENGEAYEVKVFRPQFTANNKLPFKLCVIDEAGSRVHMGNFEVPQEVLDLEDETVELLPNQGYTVPRGVTHRTRADEKTVVIMVEGNTVKPEGD